MVTEKEKEQFYEASQKSRQLLTDPDVTKCTCPETLCEWHGKCKECVALHRYHNSHLPACLHHLIEDNVKGLMKTIEVTGAKHERVPDELRLYIKERDKINADNSATGGI